MKKIATIVLFACCCFHVLPAQGPVSGFMPGRQRTDIALTHSYEQFRFYFFGRERNWRPLNSQLANLFIEHGFTDTVSLVAALPYKWIDEVNSGPQDGSLFFKYRNFHHERSWGRSSFITAVGLSFPLSRYPINTDSPIGIRATVFQTRLVRQFQFNNGIFLQLQTGLDFRFIPNALAAVPLLGRIGWGGRRWFGESWLEYYHTFDAGIDQRLSGGEGSRWWRLGASLFYRLTPHLGLVSHASYFLSGYNVGQSLFAGGGLVATIHWQGRR